MVERDAVLGAFEADAGALRAILADLTAPQWDLPTPAEGWSVRDQVAHLAFVFDLAATAATDVAAFQQKTSLAAEIGFEAAVNRALAWYNQGSGADVLGRWDTHVARAGAALAEVDPDRPVPWLVRPLPPAVLLMAGLTELFAHGQDIADAVGHDLPRTDRVAFLVPFVHHTRAFGYEARDLTPPEDDIRFSVTLPSGRVLDIGPAQAEQVVTGDAVDLCLLATRRRHRDDLRLHAHGSVADGWLDVAQAYRGPAGPGRRPMGKQVSADLPAAS